MSWDLPLVSLSNQSRHDLRASMKHVLVGFSRLSCIFEVVESTNLAKESTDIVVRNMQEEEARPGFDHVRHYIGWKPLSCTNEDAGKGNPNNEATCFFTKQI